MDVKNIISQLNWFYSWEIAQVDNYITQSKFVKDKYISLALARVACVEQLHVDNMAAHVKNLGGIPTKSGDVIAPYLGKLIGSITPSTGLSNMLRVNVAIELKAKTDYKKFIDNVTDIDLLKTLWDNFIDEDFHTVWMIEEISHIDYINEKKKLNL